MKIAIPLANKLLCMHFGHCQEFALVDVDPQEKKILNTEMLVPPAHAPGVLPAWLAEQGANMVIAGGMGSRAQMLFEQQGIKVIVGAPGDSPEEIVTKYLNNTLETGQNVCDH